MGVDGWLHTDAQHGAARSGGRRTEPAWPRGRRHRGDQRHPGDVPLLQLEHRAGRQLGRPRQPARHLRLDLLQRRLHPRQHDDDDDRPAADGELRLPDRTGRPRPQPGLGPVRVRQRPVHLGDPGQRGVDLLLLRADLHHGHRPDGERAQPDGRTMVPGDRVGGRRAVQ